MGTKQAKGNVMIDPDKVVARRVKMGWKEQSDLEYACALEAGRRGLNQNPIRLYTIKRVETMESDLSFSRAAFLADVLKVSLDWLRLEVEATA